MSLGFGGAGRLPAAFMTTGSSSFTEFISAHSPELLPSRRALPVGGTVEAPHGTTIVALTYEGGVVMAGDRRATMGNLIANRDMDKVFAADEYSAVGIAGTAGLAIEVVKLFQVELEHYEKIEGTLLSVEGKANRLASMIRANLAMAMQGLSVVPMFAGFDLDAMAGRIFSYDVTGGCYEEHDHHSVGSGSLFARGAMKKLWRPGMDSAAATAWLSRRSMTLRTTTRRPAVLTSVDGSGRPLLWWMAAGCGSWTTTRWPPLSSRSWPTAAATPEVPDDHAVLRLARAADEGPGRLRAQGDRPRPLRRGSGL